MKRFGVKPSLAIAGEKERGGTTLQGFELPQLDFRDLSLPSWVHEIAKEFFSVMKPEKSGQEPIDPSLKKQRQKKRKRGMHL